MAEPLIVEVRDLRGRLISRHSVVSHQVRVGRAFDNDIILDDPHVDAHHALLDVTPGDATLCVSDLGSLNGIQLGRRAASAEGDPWPLGQPIEMGRTTVTVVAADTPVLQAVPLHSTLVRGVSGSPFRSLALSGIAVLYVLLGLFLTDYDQGGWVSWGGGALGALVLLCLWAGAWSVGAKLASRPAAFLAHLGWVSAFLLVALPLGTLTSYAGYLFPASLVVDVLGSMVSTWLLVSLLLFGHLELVSRRSSRFKLIASGSGVAILFAIGLLANAAVEDHTTPVSSSLRALRWIPSRVVPTTSVEEFEADLLELKDVLDEDALEVVLQ